MTTDRDDDAIARRYRATATEEPPGALDDAILAASRRAVRARPGGWKRWSGPVSIAAVLVLAVGVVTRMQVEQPGVETSLPAREAPAAAQPASPPPPSPRPPSPTPPSNAPPPQPVTPKAKPLARDRAVAKEVKRAPEPFAPSPPALEKSREDASPRSLEESAPAVSQPAAPAPQLAPAPQRRPEAAPANAGAMAAPSPAAPAGMAVQRNTLATHAKSLAAVPATPEAELDRIAKLRSDGRDDEADRALEAFRRAYPDFTIPDAQWERVKRRAP